MISILEFRGLLAANRHKLNQKIAPARLPVAQERMYRRRLRKLQEEAYTLLLAELQPVLNPTALQRDSRDFFRPFFRTDANEIGRAIDEVEAKFWKKWTRPRMARLVVPVAGDVQRAQAADGNRRLRPIVGVDVFGAEPWLEQSAAGFVERNVALIKTIPQTLFDEVEARVTQAVTQGQRWEDLSKIIEDRFNVSKSRADLIARDQTTKFFGELQRQRNKGIGIEKERWNTQNDNRVRESHEDLEGVEYNVEKPPLGGPGWPVGCRCFGSPVLELG